MQNEKTIYILNQDLSIDTFSGDEKTIAFLLHNAKNIFHDYNEALKMKDYLDCAVKFNV